MSVSGYDFKTSTKAVISFEDVFMGHTTASIVEIIVQSRVVMVFLPLLDSSLIPSRVNIGSEFSYRGSIR
jgi:hypothetical protein